MYFVSSTVARWLLYPVSSSSVYAPIPPLKINECWTRNLDSVITQIVNNCTGIGFWVVNALALVSTLRLPLLANLGALVPRITVGVQTLVTMAKLWGCRPYERYLGESIHCWVVVFVAVLSKPAVYKIECLRISFFLSPFPAIQAVGDVNRSTAPCLTLDEPEEVYPQEHLPTVAKMNASCLGNRGT
jgi:hypothetical protein